MLHVCSLAYLHETAKQSGAKHLITLISAGTEVERPEGIKKDNHLLLEMNDIASPAEDMTEPNAVHVEQLIDFVDAWDQKNPLLIHCWAGISRSTAGAFIASCRLNPKMEENEIAVALRTASPSASPNPLLISIADRILDRQGRMVEAIRKIGSGRYANEGKPFNLWFDSAE